MNTQNSLDDRQHEAEIARRERLRIALDAWWERLTQRTSEWNLETVKHLVVLNAAGIAGVATLLAGAGHQFRPAWVGPAILFGYGLGVIFAVLNMYLVSVDFDRKAVEVKTRIARVYDLSDPLDDVFNDLSAGRRFGIAGQVCGWLSAASAVLSTVTLGVSLMR